MARPLLTAGVLRRAFRELHLTPPVVRIQPEGYRTLVNLETFYRVTWGEVGYRPGEVAEVWLLGRRVRFLPGVAAVRYRFGDGRGAGPTSDLGGKYPAGRIRHTYQRAGMVPVSATVIYTGRYALDGGPWREVGIVVPVAGPPAAVQVKQAHNRLIAGPR